MRIHLLIPIILIVTLFFSIFYFKPQRGNYNEYREVIEACVNLCLYAKSQGVKLESQCLSDLFPHLWKYKDWVCDVAHWPRKEIDNLPQNQCKDWWVKAKNFVEVDPNCKPIRIFVYGKMSQPMVIKE